jgi:hypothetical protein
LYRKVRRWRKQKQAGSKARQELHEAKMDAERTYERIWANIDEVEDKGKDQAFYLGAKFKQRINAIA